MQDVLQSHKMRCASVRHAVRYLAKRDFSCSIAEVCRAERNVKNNEPSWATVQHSLEQWSEVITKYESDFAEMVEELWNKTKKINESMNFYDVIQEFDFIDHAPTRLILAHLVCFYDVDVDAAYNLWVHYRHCDQESIESLEEFVNDGGPTPGPSLFGTAPDKEGSEDDFYNDCVPEEHKMKCLNCGKFRR